MYCPDCGEDPCVCKEEHANTWYQDAPGEDEWQDQFDSPGDDFDTDNYGIYPDPDGEEIFF